jgi:hypothetical protein
VERSLADAKVEAVSTDLRFIAAFNAALCVATTALRASGHRTSTQAGHHVKTIESLELSIKTSPKLIQRFKTFNNGAPPRTTQARSHRHLRDLVVKGRMNRAVRSGRSVAPISIPAAFRFRQDNRDAPVFGLLFWLLFRFLDMVLSRDWICPASRPRRAELRTLLNEINVPW